jgi:molecular chaperone GrpE
MTTREHDANKDHAAADAGDARREELDDLVELFSAYEANETLRVRESEHQKQMRKLLTELLKIADALGDLERCCAQGRAVTCKSVGLVRRMLMRVLQAERVEPIKCIGRHVDVERHEVVGVAHVPAKPFDVVLQEILRGYMWDNRVLRPAKVIVNGAPAGAA